MASLTSVMKRINLISDLRGRVRKACDCSFIHWHRVSWCISVPCWICITVYPVKTPLGSFTQDASPRYWRLPSPPFCHLNQDLFVHCQLMKKVKSRARDGVMTICQLMSHCIRLLVRSFSRSLARLLSPLRPFILSSFPPLVPSFLCPIVPSSLRALVPSSPQPFVPSSHCPFVPSSLRLFVPSFRPFVLTLVRLFVRSFRWLQCSAICYFVSFLAVIRKWICWTLDHPL